MRGNHPRRAFSFVLKTVPGLGPVWVKHLQQDLGIATLEELEAAVYDGRLEHASGTGAKRLPGIRDSLAARLARVRPAQMATSETPSVAELLDVDREFREGVPAGRLRIIAPRRFSPTHSAWLPILRTHRGERRYTALCSNTARAHQSGRTNDGVVIYEEGADSSARSCTVITSHRGPFGVIAHEISHAAARRCHRFTKWATIANIVYPAAQVAALIFTGRALAPTMRCSTDSAGWAWCWN